MCFCFFFCCLFRFVNCCGLFVGLFDVFFSCVGWFRELLLSFCVVFFSVDFLGFVCVG